MGEPELQALAPERRQCAERDDEPHGGDRGRAPGNDQHEQRPRDGQDQRQNDREPRPEGPSPHARHNVWGLLREPQMEKDGRDPERDDGGREPTHTAEPLLHEPREVAGPPQHRCSLADGEDPVDERKGSPVHLPPQSTHTSHADTASWRTSDPVRSPTRSRPWRSRYARIPAFTFGHTSGS